MSDNIGRAGAPEYAEPAFYKSPSASSLPIPKFGKCSSTVSGVSSDSEKSSTSSTKLKSVSFASDTKSHDGKRAISATKEQDKPIDQKAKTAISPSFQRSTAFEKLAKRIREDNEAQAKSETAQQQTSETLELQRRQQAVIDCIEKKPTKVILRAKAQEFIPIRDQLSTFLDNVQRQAGQMQQMSINQENQEMWQRTNLLLQLATKKLEQNLAKQQEILQRRLDEVNQEIKHEEGNLADEETGQTSSSNDEDSFASIDDETTLVGTETDTDEHHHREIIPASNPGPVANFLVLVFSQYSCNEGLLSSRDHSQKILKS
ncbi:MAG: hypothetical protein ALECFALPRED_009914 [Alectoria fallacina]|uniref:Uncharacterized protein n=1 Tax=Alectoria fallacina TaxID=1903189 RepID=A0A8H3J8R4_9LECA|nr:MAG: hypothetical protein ALECFALPRED_009914 [Alectoria fallacina]